MSYMSLSVKPVVCDRKMINKIQCCARNRGSTPVGDLRETKKQDREGSTLCTRGTYKTHKLEAAMFYLEEQR